jgi:tetratricopeptide (TPR) repeat protein/TolB-like protein/predicted Ser/Thr protein kinase
MIGRTISHYKILEKLGQGGMGVLYKAEDTKLTRIVAIKFLLPTALPGGEVRARFIHEAKAAASLNHPNICTIYEIDDFEGQPFIAMEFVEGRSLTAVIESGPLKLEQVRDIASQLATGLQHAHEKCIVHRDIKPSNIMITPAGLAKIMDFGLARVEEQTKLTREGTTVGTVAYMSPEQVRAEAIDHRTDVWSLGVILYEMVSGQRPFKGDYDQVVMYSICNDEPAPLTSLRTGVPLELERITMKALAKQPAERYQHADELLSDLRRLGSMSSGEKSKRASAEASIRAELARPKGGPEPAPPGTGAGSGLAAMEDESGPAPARADAQLERATVEGEPEQAPATVETARKRRRIALPVSALVVAGLAVSYLFLRPLITEQRLSASPRPIAVISFENLTGDPQFDYLSTAIPNLLITSLEQSGYLRVATWERMRDLIKELGKGETGTIDKELGFELCRRDGIDLIVTGSFTKAGDVFATDIKVLKVETKELVRTASARGDGVESILKRQVDELSREISRGVGLSLSRIEATQRPVIDVTTTSMDAYNHFLRGKDEYERFYFDDARPELEKAVQLDSTFAVGHLYLAFTYARLGEPDAYRAAYERARKYSSRATDKERLLIESYYATDVEKDQAKSMSLLEELIRKYPKEKSAHNALAKRYDAAERYEDAVKEYDTVLKLDPTYAPAFNSLAYSYMRLENYERALEYLKRYASLSPGDRNPLDSMGELYFLMGDLDKAIGKYREALEVRPGFFGSILRIAYIHGVKGEYDSTMSLVDRYINSAPSAMHREGGYCFRAYFLLRLGNPDQALEDMRRRIELTKSSTFPDGKPYAYETMLFAAYETGHYDDARRFLARRRASWRGEQLTPRQRNTLEAYCATLEGMIELKSGNQEAAGKAFNEIKGLSIPEDSQISYSFVRNVAAIFEGEFLLAEGRPREAIEAVSKRFKLETPFMDVNLMAQWNIPMDQDVVARSYARLGDLDRAIAEYKKLIEFNPKSRDRRLNNPRYYYRLAKLYEQKGRQTEARREYERFLFLWKNADRRLPEYVDAAARLKKLSGSTGS